MSYKTILAILQSKSDTKRVLDHALPIAASFGGHVIGVHAEPLAIPYATAVGFPDAEFIEASAEASSRQTEDLRKIFEAEAVAARQSAEWRSMESISGDSALGALAAARAADLVIAAQTNPDDESIATANIDHLLFETGRPALFVPYAGAVKTHFAKILLAWNGTREAARATFDALPFLKAAEAVEVLTIDAPKSNTSSEPSGREIAAALARHGIATTVSALSSAGIGVNAAIEKRASETGADLLVMGAFGHSRLREFLFGGVTRSALKSMPIATFMSR